MKVTVDFLEQGKSIKGGWSRKQLRILGTQWPPNPGWKKWVVGIELTDEAAQWFLHIGRKTFKSRGRFVPQYLHGKLVKTPWSQLPADLRDAIVAVDLANAETVRKKFPGRV